MDKLSPPYVRTGIVIPTLGNRPEYLEKCIASIQNANKCQIVVVTPSSAKLENSYELIPSISIVDDLGKGLADAINAGIRGLPDTIEFCSWIGDDDLLEPDSVSICEAILDANSDAVMVFGRCKYITSDGEVIGINKSGQWAAPLLRIGPCLIPQPGSLFRRKAFDEIGGLDSKYGWAFDFDLFIRLSKVGKLVHTKRVLACFRWHSDSLTVGQRRNSVREASLVRRAHLPKFLIPISILWELPVKFFTLNAGRLVAHKASKNLDH
jgi:GT2 family glycosyltransferase